MEQLLLLDPPEASRRLDTCIERVDNMLTIPEGLHTTPCTHGMHRFAGKFIPNVARYLLRSLPCRNSNRALFDPFCGSGTTLVEAALAGRKYVGVDIDPLSVSISTAKTRRLSERELILLAGYWRKHNYEKAAPEMVPKVPNLSHWFSDHAVLQLSSIKAGCVNLPPRLRDFSLVVFSSIIRRTSNADDQTQKTYVSHTLPKTPATPATLFPIFLKRAIDGMMEYRRLLPKEPDGMVLQRDCAIEIEDLEFSDVLTSPPYIDSIDYVYNQMLEYYWLLEELGVGTYENYRQLRKRPMGFRVAKELSHFDSLTSFTPARRALFDAACARIGEESPKEEVAVRSFFLDYARHIQIIRSKQHRGYWYTCIIGNSHVRGVTIPTAELIADLLTSSGYRLLDRMTYQIRRHYMKFPRRSNSGRIDQDHILVFEASE